MHLGIREDLIEDNTGIKGKPLPSNLQYKSVLQREVPWCGIVPNHPDFDKDLCWWCQKDLRIIAKPDVIIWCQNCYKLHYKRHNGEFMEQSTIGIGKDLIDIQTGKIKPKYMTVDKDNGKVIIED